jgi:hypothetical protein
MEQGHEALSPKAWSVILCQQTVKIAASSAKTLGNRQQRGSNGANLSSAEFATCPEICADLLAVAIFRKCPFIITLSAKINLLE